MLTHIPAGGSLPLSVSMGVKGPWKSERVTVLDAVSYSIAAPWFLANGMLLVLVALVLLLVPLVMPVRC